ncbi:MAG: 2-C-methyl-D-erythritol 2,4-cyclodiphosphate synthase [Bacteroidales bacterium]
MKLRTGIGYDVHQLVHGKKLIIGGIEIPHEKGCLAYSDGDILIHAICDALLGAGGLGDIGTHFPDTDTRYRNIDSRILLEKVKKMISQKGYEISNIDSVICLQKPKIKDYISSIRSSLSAILNIDKEDISVKATTTEKLGFTGREEGVSAYATVLLVKN